MRQRRTHHGKKKREIHQKEITIINLYAPNFIKHVVKDLKVHINSNTAVAGDLSTTNR
jgi:hypothetical protein